jgi:lipopolysaccharide assembly outer membrane protein LptD (OstA)
LSAKSLILTCSLLALTPAYGADELSCETSLGRALAVDSPLREIVLDNPDTIQLEAGEFEAQLGPSPTARMSGGVLLRRDDKIAGADSAYYDPDQRALFLQGRVLYEDPHTQIQSRSAEFGYELGRIRFEGAEFSLGESNSRGAAEDLEINQDGTLSLGNVEYTTCPPDSEDWLLQGKSIVLDTGEGIGTATDPRDWQRRAQWQRGARANLLEYRAELRCHNHAESADQSWLACRNTVSLPEQAQ